MMMCKFGVWVLDRLSMYNNACHNHKDAAGGGANEEQSMGVDGHGDHCGEKGRR